MGRGKEMSKINKSTYIAALDIGTHKISLAVGELLPDNKLVIANKWVEESHGIVRGVIRDAEALSNAFQRLFDEAELKNKYKLTRVFVNVFGSHVQCQTEAGMSMTENGIVSEKDVKLAVQTAEAVPIGEGREILHTFPKRFVVDKTNVTQQPRGLDGLRVETDVLLVTHEIKIVELVERLLAEVGIEIQRLVYSGVASARSVLTEEEKNTGVVLVDMGAGTMDICVYKNGVYEYVSVLAIGGDSVTNDIAKAIRISMHEAENLKKEQGSVDLKKYRHDDVFHIYDHTYQKKYPLMLQNLTEFVNARYVHLIEVIWEELERNVLFQKDAQEVLPAGIVFTGGAAQIDGLDTLCYQHLGMRTRIKFPAQSGGLFEKMQAPEYATTIGLLQMAAEYQEDLERTKGIFRRSSFLYVFWSKLRTFFGNF